MSLTSIGFNGSVGSLFRALFPLLLAGCGGAAPVFEWPKLVECADGVPEVIPKVSTILISDAGSTGISPYATKQLLDLGKQVGADAVVCAVDLLVHDWLAPGSSQIPEQLGAASRGQQWLSVVGAEVRRP